MIAYYCPVTSRKLMKAKGPAAAKADEEKKKGLTLFGNKPPTPKLMRAFGGFGKGGLLDRLKVLECSVLRIFCTTYIFPSLSYPT